MLNSVFNIIKIITHCSFDDVIQLWSAILITSTAYMMILPWNFSLEWTEVGLELFPNCNCRSRMTVVTNPAKTFQTLWCWVFSPCTHGNISITILTISKTSRAVTEDSVVCSRLWSATAALVYYTTWSGVTMIGLWKIRHLACKIWNEFWMILLALLKR